MSLFFSPTILFYDTGTLICLACCCELPAWHIHSINICWMNGIKSFCDATVFEMTAITYHKTCQSVEWCDLKNTFPTVGYPHRLTFHRYKECYNIIHVQLFPSTLWLFSWDNFPESPFYGSQYEDKLLIHNSMWMKYFIKQKIWSMSKV